MNFLPFSISFLYPAFLWLLLLIPLFVVLGWPERSEVDRRRKWLGVGVRLVVFVSLALGLAGAQAERPVETITTVFVLDASDSISAAAEARAENFLREALADKPAEDRAAVVLFGGDALVERLPRVEADMPALASTPVKNATDIEEALRLALALLPNEGGRRIVLLSDGRQTEGQARRLTELAAARNIEISSYALEPVGEAGDRPEVLVESVSAPGQARQGQAVPVEVVVRAGRPVEATLRLLAGGAPLESRAVRLVQGRNRFSFTIPVTETGFQRFRLEVEPAEDGWLQNNWGAAFTTVYGPPQVLLVEGQPGEAAALTAALEATGLSVAHIDAAALPDDLPALAAYDAVILANVPAADLPPTTQETLVAFVRDLGRGLVMIGGPDSYGAGGYLRSPLEKALPVDMEVRNRSREPNIALVLAVDKSGSMGACHCDDPASRLERQSRMISGLPKIDIAKEAVIQATAALGELDYLGVVSFDGSAHWEIEPGPWVAPQTVEQSIGGMAANGQTNIYAGLAAAEEALATTPARIKHIILLTDGWSSAGAYDDLTARLAEQGITLSVVAAGGGSAGYLAELARQGGGEYYPAASMTDVPQIFLKETIRAVGDYIIEEPFLPAPALSGAVNPILRDLDLESSPPLLGYNGTTLKAAARASLLTPRGDPLLATWQYGLGRSVAWTSDLSGRWAQQWLAWDEFARFAGQLVNWTLPLPGDERLDVRVSVTAQRATLTAAIDDRRSQPGRVVARLSPPDGEAIETELIPGGPNRYETDIALPAEGVYLAQVTAYEPDADDAAEALPLAGQTIGIVVPYSAEYAAPAGDPTLPADLARATGGRLLDNPEQAFAHDLVTGRQTQPLWPALLLLAALLFPVDVAVRRLRLGRREWRQARQAVAGRFSLGGPAEVAPSDAPASPTLSAFRRAQERVRRQSAPPAPTSPAPPERSPVPSGDQAAPPAPASDDAGDTLARLRAAKKRAKK